ncbi:MAG: hypothetical protein M3Y42_07130 [Actinomycetota bacterium]|nr:hypothetical protein [Actinomycetota bacterium]MDQ2956719.1 hypothetical protein [Actinomycetota bacterium]
MKSQRLLASIIGTGLIMAGGGLLAPQTASAAAGDSLECANGSYGMPGYNARCFLFAAGASQETWTVNGYAFPAGNGSYFITFNCGAKNRGYAVQVNYLDGNGVSSQLYGSGTCGTLTP